MAMQICLPIRRSPDEAFLTQHTICIPLYLQPLPKVPTPIPPEDPFAHLQTLGTIAQLAASLSDLTPMRQELLEVSQRALETAVEGLGEDFQLVDSDALAGQA
jgi:hypothetical protein